MAGVCPLCGEEYNERELAGYPHICKSIPMPNIGQCEKCGTALNDLNVSDMYPILCRGCAATLPGNRDEAIQIIANRGRALLVFMSNCGPYIWFYVTSNDRLMLDLLRRSYQGRIQHHRSSFYKWTCSRRFHVLDVARDLHKLEYNLKLSGEILSYCRELDHPTRAAIVHSMLKEYGHKCLHIVAKK